MSILRKVLTKCRAFIISAGMYFAFSGLKPSKSLGFINNSLKYGQWIKKHDFVKLDSARNSDGSRNLDGSRNILWDYINNNEIKNTPIDYLEFGVFKGDSIKQWLKLNKNSGSRFFGFDSFEGLPQDYDLFLKKPLKAGTFNVNGNIPIIEDSRVSFIKGYFQNTLPVFLDSFVPKNRLVINCDADLYSSTLFILASMNKIITPGTIIFFDEFSSFDDEFRALIDYLDSFNRNCKVIAACLPNYTFLAIEVT